MLSFEKFNESLSQQIEIANKKLYDWAQSNMLMSSGGSWQSGIWIDNKPIGHFVKIATGNYDEYYFDDTDFVKNDKTILRVESGMTSLDFYNELVKLGVIQEWRFSKKLNDTNDKSGVFES